MKRHLLLVVVLQLLLLMLSASPAHAGDWELLYEEDGVEVSSMEKPGSPLVAFKGDTILEASLARVLWILMDNEHRMEWVDRLYVSTVLEQISDHEYVIYQAFKLPLFISNRDYVYHGKATIDADTGVVTLRMGSVEREGTPKTVGVRAHLVNSVYKLTPVDDGKRCRVEVEIHTDPRGWLPSWLVNLIQKSWPLKTLRGIRQLIDKPYVVDYPLPPVE